MGDITLEVICVTEQCSKEKVNGSYRVNDGMIILSKVINEVEEDNELLQGELGK